MIPDPVLEAIVVGAFIRAAGIIVGFNQRITNE
jgi:hypothetical protein